MRIRLLTVAIAFQCITLCLLLSGCSGDKIAQSEWERLAAIRAEGEDAWTDLMTAAYESDSTGLPGYYNIALAKHGNLFTRENIDLLRRIENHFGSSPDSTAIGLLKVYLVAGYCSIELADRQSSRPPLIVDLYTPGLCPSPIWSKLERELADIDDPQKRRELYTQTLADLQGTAQQIEQYRSAEDSLFKNLGYESSLDFFLEFHRTDGESIRSLANSILAASDSVYHALLAKVTGSSPSSQSQSLRLYDLLYHIDDARRDLMLPLDSLLDGMQITLTSMDMPVNLKETFDMLAVASGDYYPCSKVYPLRLPDRVRVLLGADKDAVSLLSGHIAVGRALPYYFTEARNFTSRYLGDNSGNFANGFFLGGLLSIPDYLAERFEMSQSDAARLSDVVRLLLLFQVRRDCAVTIYELALLSGEGDPGRIFTDLMGRALGVGMDDHDQTLRYDLPTVLNSADRLRGANLALRMTQKLKQDFGPKLFEQPGVGKELATLWSHGHDLSVEQELQMLGLKPLTSSNRRQ